MYDFFFLVTERVAVRLHMCLFPPGPVLHLLAPYFSPQAA